MSGIDELPSWAPRSDQPNQGGTPTGATPAATGGGGGRGLLYALLAVLVLLAAGGAAYVVSQNGSDSGTGSEPGSGSDVAAAGTEDTAAAGGAAGSGEQVAADGEAAPAADGEEGATADGDQAEGAENRDGSVRHTAIEGGKFILNGRVPTQEHMDQIVSVTVAAAGEENVVNNLVLDPTAPEQVNAYPVYIKDVVLFDVGSTEVKEDFLWLLGVGAAFLQQNPDAAITVIGHADSSGDAEANQRLSEERAEAVRDTYVSMGASADQVYVVGKGEDGATADASDDVAAGERRVEFFIGEYQGGPVGAD